MNSFLPPAHNLTGIQLESGWKLVRKITPANGATGGNFGVGYEAERDGQVAFVKAIDFVRALKSADPIRDLAQLTSAANFEREAHEFCGSKRLSKIVRILQFEYINTSPTGDPLQQVACLVLEFGEGDLRSKLSSSPNVKPSWILGVLRDVALAIEQLHRHGISHQDIKPSNVISVPDAAKPRRGGMKLGDLGRVVRKGVMGPFDAEAWPGDPHYMPPERWYGVNPKEWQDSREASDAFMLGSLVFFLFVRVSFQSLLMAEIPESFKPNIWRGDFEEKLIAVLRHAQAQVLLTSLKPNLPEEIADSVIQIVIELTDPDPYVRGDKRARRQVGHPVGMERFHQRFRELALRAAIFERTRK